MYVYLNRQQTVTEWARTRWPKTNITVWHATKTVKAGEWVKNHPIFADHVNEIQGRGLVVQPYSGAIPDYAEPITLNENWNDDTQAFFIAKQFYKNTD